MVLGITLGLLLAAAGCAGIYLASPHQRWRSQPLAAQPARSIGVVLLLASLSVLWQPLHTLAALFVWLHWMMLLWVAFPYLGAFVNFRRKSA